LVPVTCESGIFGCTIANFPWIIAGLALVLVALLGVRLALHLREGWRRKPVEQPPDNAPPPKPVSPGSPLHPPPGGKPPPPDTRPPAKPSPLKFRVSDPPDLKRASFQGDGQAQGDFGELVTAAFLASQGWKQVPSKLHGGRGIDGLFLREVRGGGGFECLATETKTNSSHYDAASMSDDKIVDTIAELYEIGAFDKAAADELARGLRQGASFFRKELWRHDLATGLTTISELGRNGEKGRSITRSSARLIGALYMSLEYLDRGSVYVGQAPIDEID
jgi:hypothetical protein